MGQKFPPERLALPCKMQRNNASSFIIFIS